jgi:hypothetical protein
MKSEVTIEQLLRWRLARAEAEAPPAPSAARLLELARPWWETWPERFRQLAERLSHLEIAYAHAMADARRVQSEQLVPALIVHTSVETESSARVLYINVRDGQLRLRFQLNAGPESSERTYEVTFVSRATVQPLFSAAATLSIDREYSLSAGLSEELETEWSRLTVTDEMPFRLILRTVESGE